MWLGGSKPVRSNVTIPTTSFSRVFFTNEVMCRVHYVVINHPFPINSQYLKTWGVDSPEIVSPNSIFGGPLLNRSTQREILRKRPKNNNKAWLWIKLSEAILSIFGDFWEKFICCSLPARLMEDFPASKVHLQPATWLTGKFPKRRMSRHYWPVLFS